jgi:hypothetical protein
MLYSSRGLVFSISFSVSVFSFRRERASDSVIPFPPHHCYILFISPNKMAYLTQIWSHLKKKIAASSIYKNQINIVTIHSLNNSHCPT